MTVDDVRALYANVGEVLFHRAYVGVLLGEIDRLLAVLETGAEQVHGMGRELQALRRQLEDSRRQSGELFRELEQL